MKKFLVYLCVIIVAVSTGFAVFFLVRDNEVISLSTTSLYREAGQKFELSLDISDPNSFTTISLESSNENVLSIENKEIDVKNSVAKASFVAKAGGVSRVNFKTNNSKFRNIYCDVVVGDGSVNYPFQISTAEQLAKIGTVVEGEENPYTLASCYELVADINMNELEGNWAPFGVNGDIPFEGVFDGNGHYINNIAISNDAQNVGLFGTIGTNGVVKNLKLNNSQVTVNANNEYVGVVAGTNKGVIERVETKGTTIYNAVNNTAYVGGIVGLNLSNNDSSVRTVAKVDRVSADVKFYNSPAVVNAETGEITTPVQTNVVGNIAGVVGYNKGGLVRFSYAVGEATIENGTTFGGLINKNEYIAIGSVSGYNQYTTNLGANVKDCYSAINVVANGNTVAGLIYENIDDNVNTIWGNYYDTSKINKTVVGVTGYADAKHFVLGKASNELKTVELASHLRYTAVLEGGIIVEKEDGEVFWNTNVWLIDGSNDGYPVLNYEALEIADENKVIAADITIVKTEDELKTAFSAGLDASIMVGADIQLTGEWVPVGDAKQPFVGLFSVGINPDTEEPYTISGLKITKNKYAYAGFFGVISNARIENLTLVDVNIDNVNHDYAGAIVGANGIAGTKNQGGVLVNCAVYGGKINAKIGVGAITGLNSGIITNPTVYGKFGNNAYNPLVLTTCLEGESYVGGVVGYNYGAVNTLGEYYGINKDAVVKGHISISTYNTTYGTVMAGGIAGKNEGTINNAYVDICYADDKNVYGINISDAMTAYIGGVAGYSNGYINNAYVSARLITGTTRVNYAGGVAGYVVGLNNVVVDQVKHINIKNAYVYNSYISSTNSAGLVGYLAGSDKVQVKYDKNNWKVVYSEALTVSSSYYAQSNLVANIAASSVQESVKLAGVNAGGLVTEIQRGFVTDCYSHARLNATNGAGMVYSIKFNNVNATGGVITRCYVIANFDGGTNKYAVTSSGVHNQANINKRTAGFIDDYFFAKTDNKAKDPGYVTKALSDTVNFVTFWDDDEDRWVTKVRKLETLRKANMWGSFAQDNAVTFSVTPWIIADGSVPTLSADADFVSVYNAVNK